MDSGISLVDCLISVPCYLSVDNKKIKWVNELDHYGDRRDMSESEDNWGENEYCDPHDDDQYARDDDDDWDTDWPEDAGPESVPESVEEREERIKAQRERVCRNCENYDQHCSISFCKRFWQFGAPLTLLTEDVLEKEGRAKNCEFYKNKYK